MITNLQCEQTEQTQVVVISADGAELLSEFVKHPERRSIA